MYCMLSWNNHMHHGFLNCIFNYTSDLYECWCLPLSVLLENLFVIVAQLKHTCFHACGFCIFDTLRAHNNLLLCALALSREPHLFYLIRGGPRSQRRGLQATVLDKLYTRQPSNSLSPELTRGLSVSWRLVLIR